MVTMGGGEGWIEKGETMENNELNFTSNNLYI